MNIRIMIAIGIALGCAAEQGLAFSTNQSASIVIGQSDMNHNDANQGGATGEKTLYYPSGVVINSNRVFIADTNNNRVLIYMNIPVENNTAATYVLGQQTMLTRSGDYGTTGLQSPQFVDSNGNFLFVNDLLNHRILIYNYLPMISHAAASLEIGQIDMNHNVIGGSSQGLNWPAQISCDGTKVAVADEHNHRVLIFNQIPTGNHTAADVVLGQANKEAAGINHGNGAGSPAANSLYYPAGVCLYNGKLLIADAYNNRVLIFNTIPTSDDAAANVVVGQSNKTLNAANQSGTPGPNTLSDPRSIFYNGGKLIVADTGNNRVLVYNSLPTIDNTSADAVLGQASMNTGSINQGSGVGAKTLNHPYEIMLYSNNLLVADKENHRVLIYDESTRTATPTQTMTATITPTPTISVTSTISPTFTITDTPWVEFSATITHTPLVDALGHGYTEDFCYAAPNPIRGGAATLCFYSTQPATISVKFFTITHDQVLNFEGSVSSGRNVISQNVSGLANGVYLLLVEWHYRDGSEKRRIEKVAVIK